MLKIHIFLWYSTNLQNTIFWVVDLQVFSIFGGDVLMDELLVVVLGNWTKATFIQGEMPHRCTTGSGILDTVWLWEAINVCYYTWDKEAAIAQCQHSQHSSEHSASLLSSRLSVSKCHHVISAFYATLKYHIKPISAYCLFRQPRTKSLCYPEACTP